MDRNEILQEIEKWGDEQFTDRVESELNKYSQEIDLVLYKRYIKQILEQSDEKLKNKALKRLRQRNLINEDNELIERTDDVIFDSSKPIINGAHDSATDKIIFNPKGAKSYYQSFLQFEEGKRDGIRDFDYKVDIKELPDLTPAEILYWCYENNVRYEEFCKITLLHENVHKWTLRGATGMVAVMMGKDEVVMIEGLVEQEARAVAEENPQLIYNNCFRNDELNLVNFLSQYYDPSNSLLYQSGDRFCTNAVRNFLESKGVSDEEIREEFNKIIENLTNICEREFSGAPNAEFDKSFYDIFLRKQELVSEEILKIFEGYEPNDKAKNITISDIGKATINVPTNAKVEAGQVENGENTKDNVKKGEEVGDDN